MNLGTIGAAPRLGTMRALKGSSAVTLNVYDLNEANEAADGEEFLRVVRGGPK